MEIILCLSDFLGTSGSSSGISSTSDSDFSKPGLFSDGTGWRLRRRACAEERGRVFLSIHFLFIVMLQPFTKGMTELERANEESAASTMASNRNKSGYSIT